MFLGHRILGALPFVILSKGTFSSFRKETVSGSTRLCLPFESSDVQWWCTTTCVAQRMATAAMRRAWKAYASLSKARLSALVASTSTAGFVLGSGEHVDVSKLGWTTLGTLGAACAANATNQLMEVTHDARMTRTRIRPLPSGRLRRPHAVAFAVACGGLGVATLHLQTNDLAAGLAAGTIALYTLAYTPMKQRHPINTWIGAVVGALPPLIGWAAAQGQLDPGAGVLALGLYFWQIPHFMALAWLCKDDYIRGGYRMVSLADVSGKKTAAIAMRNALYMAPLGFMAVSTGVATNPFAYECVAMSAAFGLVASSMYRNPSLQQARKLFRASLIHLPTFMGALMLHRRPNAALLLEGEGKENEDSREEEEGSKQWRREGGALPSMSSPPFPFLPIPPMHYPTSAECQIDTKE